MAESSPYLAGILVAGNNDRFHGGWSRVQLCSHTLSPVDKEDILHTLYILVTTVHFLRNLSTKLCTLRDQPKIVTSLEMKIPMNWWVTVVSQKVRIVDKCYMLYSQIKKVISIFIITWSGLDTVIGAILSHDQQQQYLQSWHSLANNVVPCMSCTVYDIISYDIIDTLYHCADTTIIKCIM